MILKLCFFNPSVKEAEAGRFQVQSQPGLRNETCIQKWLSREKHLLREAGKLSLIPGACGERREVAPGSDL